MSFGGIKKQWNKANQYVSEKIGNENEKTKMEDEFIEMERKVDVTYKAISELMTLTKEYLQPNPTIRAKMNMMNTYQKIQGKQRDVKYPQSEGNLGECMSKYGNELGADSNFGNALKETGEALSQLSEIKDSLDVGVKQDFLDPLQQLCDKDIKEVMHHRKKLSGRRLDYDYKRKKGAKLAEGELQLAGRKLQDALELADNSMSNVLNSDVSGICQTSASLNLNNSLSTFATIYLKNKQEKQRLTPYEYSLIQTHLNCFENLFGKLCTAGYSVARFDFRDFVSEFGFLRLSIDNQ